MLFEGKNQIPPIETFKLGSRYYFARLSPNDRVWYRQIYDAWLTGSAEVTLTIPGTGHHTPDGTDWFDLVVAVLEDNPHLFHLEPSHFYCKRTGDQLHISSNSIYSQQEFWDMYALLWQRVSYLLEEAKKYNEKIDQLRFLHDYLAQTITYDYCYGDPRKEREAHTMVGALINRHCVCDGYSRTFRLLCDRLGISCIVVLGKGPKDKDPGGHAWNIVKLDQIPYHVDVTWDSNLSQDGVLKDYEFMQSDLSADRRHIWQRDKYPKCPKDWPRREKLLSTEAELEAEFVRHLKGRHKQCLLRLGGPLTDQEVFFATINQLCSKHNALLPKKGVLRYNKSEIYHYGVFRYESNNQ